MMHLSTARRTSNDVTSIIHASTGIYTVDKEIRALLDEMDWPARGSRLLDPGAGNGGFLVEALSRLDMGRDDVATAVRAVHGYEFHQDAVDAARASLADHLISRGWSPEAASRAARLIVEVKDFLVDAVPVGVWDRIAANPPYLRYANLPVAYRPDYDAATSPHARSDMLYAYLEKVAEVIAPNGVLGIISADRWLLNSGSAELRRRLGETWSISTIRRLESASAFYRPKSKRKGTPARVHPVAMVMTTGEGRRLTSAPFAIDVLPDVEGRLLKELATIRLAPWLGPDGIFMVDDPTAFSPDETVPCFEPEDLTGTIASKPRRWAIVTGTERPSERIMAHLERNLDRMPAGGRQRLSWLPPETFHGRLPLKTESVVVPRISRTLRGVRLPAGTMPVNHNLVVVSGLSSDRMLEILSDERVRAQADALALRLESGYRSYTATLLRSLRIPDDLLS